ncbi:MAG: hypothetical protein LBE12_21075 [Planctomycetaceae bacterium]|nr:hypothetical protein [Planctomycetaceae bacterium]
MFYWLSLTTQGKLTPFTFGELEIIRPKFQSQFLLSLYSQSVYEKSDCLEPATRLFLGSVWNGESVKGDLVFLDHPAIISANCCQVTWYALKTFHLMFSRFDFCIVATRQNTSLLFWSVVFYFVTKTIQQKFEEIFS